MSATKVRHHSVVRFEMYDRLVDTIQEFNEFCPECFEELTAEADDYVQIVGTHVLEVRHISWCDQCGCRINPRSNNA